jgi:hypothetical protein
MAKATPARRFRVSFVGHRLVAEGSFPPHPRLALEATDDRSQMVHFVADFGLPDEAEEVPLPDAALLVSQQYGLHCRTLSEDSPVLRVSVVERLTVPAPEEGPASAQLLTLTMASRAIARLDADLADGTFLTHLYEFLRATKTR